MSTSRPETATIRVLVVDDHDLVVYALTTLLDVEDDIEVVGSTGNGEHAIELVTETDVDVVVLDRRLEDSLDAISLIGRLRDSAARTRVLVLSGTSDDVSVARAVEAGCHGFLSKHRPPAEIVSAVRTVAAGGTAFAPDVLDRLERADPPSGRSASLTAREIEVLRLLAQGQSTAEIASGLFVSVNTVRNHVNSVMKKLGAHSRLEAVSEGVKLGLVELG